MIAKDGDFAYRYAYKLGMRFEDAERSIVSAGNGHEYAGMLWENDEKVTWNSWLIIPGIELKKTPLNPTKTTRSGRDVFSRDYTHVRLAALPDNVLGRLLAKYPVVKEDGTPLTAPDVRAIEAAFAKDIPGKEDLATEWFLQALHYNRAQFPSSLLAYVGMARWFFTYQKTPLFKQVVEDYSVSEGRVLNPKNLMDFTGFDLERFPTIYVVAEKRARVNRFPENVPDGATLIYNDGNHKILKITGEEAACDLAEGTDWCTDDEEHAEHYLMAGPLYVLYRNQNKIAQLYLGDAAYMVELKNLKNRSWTPDPEIRQVLIKSGLMASILELLSEDPVEYKNTILRFLGKQDEPNLRRYCSGDPYLAYYYATEVPPRRRFRAGEFEMMKEAQLITDYASMLEEWDPDGYQGFKEDYPELFGRSRKEPEAP